VYVAALPRCLRQDMRSVGRYLQSAGDAPRRTDQDPRWSPLVSLQPSWHRTRPAGPGAGGSDR
jgi:hypothetical protein